MCLEQQQNMSTNNRTIKMLMPHKSIPPAPLAKNSTMPLTRRHVEEYAGRSPLPKMAINIHVSTNTKPTTNPTPTYRAPPHPHPYQQHTRSRAGQRSKPPPSFPSRLLEHSLSCFQEEHNQQNKETVPKKVRTVPINPCSVSLLLKNTIYPEHGFGSLPLNLVFWLLL